ncbi:MAG TPA: aminotransferase class IV [Verrucomicrobiae bacterium]|nr:aminotransferase class IV [Verrucomicrobiae bacterium]
MKFVCINGEIVSAETARVPVLDRGFMYGDGLFETLRVTAGQPGLWDAHWDRLRMGAELLRINLPSDSRGARSHIDKLLEENQAKEAVLRIQLSRGVGLRGYSPRETKAPVIVITTHPLPATPATWRLAMTSFRLPARNPLSGVKTTSKLLHILARAEADERGADEGLLLTDSGAVAQGTSSNLFWIERKFVCTAPEQSGILPGVTRGAVLRACGRLNIPVRQTTAQPERLKDCDGLFLTLSTFGVVEAAHLDGRELSRSPLTAQIRETLVEAGGF